MFRVVDLVSLVVLVREVVAAEAPVDAGAAKLGCKANNAVDVNRNTPCGQRQGDRSEG